MIFAQETEKNHCRRVHLDRRRLGWPVSLLLGSQESAHILEQSNIPIFHQICVRMSRSTTYPITAYS